MESFIIVAREQKRREDYAVSICKDNNVDVIDIQTVESQTSISIADIRGLQKQIFLKPLRGKIKACIIKNAHTLTIEAQNAMLKLLEEPPPNTIIILTSENKYLLLPTILSRCKIIELSFNDRLQTVGLSTFNSQLSITLKSGIGDRLKLAQDIAKNKDEAIIWLENSILTIRQQLIESIMKKNYEMNSSISNLNILISFNKTYTIIKTTNANLRLTLENLFLKL